MNQPATPRGARTRSTAPAARGPGWIVGLILFAVGGFALSSALMTGVAASQVAERDELVFDNSYCLGCHEQPGMQTTLPSGEVLDLTFDSAAFSTSVHGSFELPCALCHTNITPFPHDPITATDMRAFAIERADACRGCHYERYTEELDGVHLDALESGNPDAAVCTDCHGSHDISAPVADSPQVQLACQRCHADQYQLFEQSVHGAALVGAGSEDVPTCTDCHGPHSGQVPADDEFSLLSPQICTECHTDDELMDSYGISTNVLDSHVSDFHGSTEVLFENVAPGQKTNQPVCVDCHGVHGVQDTDDPEQLVIKANLAQSCQRCHPDTDVAIATSWLDHYPPEPGEATLVWLVRWIYWIIIPLLVGGLFVYLVIESRRRARAVWEKPA